MRGPGRVRRLARTRCVWAGLGSAGRRTRMGTVPLWALGLNRAVGLDMDRRCALGFCTIPLRPLDRDRWRLGLGAGAGAYPRRLRARIGCLYRRRTGAALLFSRRGWSGSGVASARTARSVCSALSLQPGVRDQREHQSYRHKWPRRFMEYGHDAPALCEPRCSGRGDGSAGGRIYWRQPDHTIGG
jgi:hypothetical protein